MTALALCVGINQFAHLPMASWLYGCVNDAQDMAEMLLQHGFPREGITVLTDNAATKAAVLGALTQMVAGAAPGDHLVFSFSSHGTQVPDKDGDEADGADEAFACHDIAQDGHEWNRATVIVDDELGALFDSLAQDVSFEVFLDTCHSGTGLKAEDLSVGRLPRFLPAPTRLGRETLADSAHRTSTGEFARTSQGASKAVLLAACRADQTSVDATFGDRSNGAFTYYLLKAMERDPTASRASTIQTLTTSLRDHDFGQRPTLEGPSVAMNAAVGQPW